MKMLFTILEIVLFPLFYLYRTFTFQVQGAMAATSLGLTVVAGIVMVLFGLDGAPVAVIAVFAYILGVIQYGEVRTYGLDRGSINELIANATSLIIFLCTLVLIF